jgi:hypothetical protein
MHARLAPLALVLTGCVSATFQSTNGATFPPIADRALGADASIANAGAQRIGSVDTSGQSIATQSDLADKAALVAARAGGTHIVTTRSGVTTQEVTTPASSSTTCTDNTDSSTCTTTTTPESTTTVSTPYASYDVYRVERERWSALDPSERPTWDPDIHVPSSADGWGLSFGEFSTPFPGAPSGTSGDVFPTAYTADVPALQGGWISISDVNGSTELGFDMRVGGTSYSGIAMNTQQRTVPVAYTGTYSGAAAAFRVGKRVAWSDFALAAGVGLGGAVWISMAPHTDPTAPIEATFVEPGQGAVTDLYAPVWASLTFKPSCSWGVQGLAEYDVRSNTDESSPSLSLGLIWQPATACF